MKMHALIVSPASPLEAFEFNTGVHIHDSLQPFGCHWFEFTKRRMSYRVPEEHVEKIKLALVNLLGDSVQVKHYYVGDWACSSSA